MERQYLTVKSGQNLHVRPIRADDEPRLHEAFARLSEQSVYYRFFTTLRRLPDAMARRFADVDHRDRVALVATTHLPDGPERIVGVARYDRIAKTSAAEVAVTVIDEYQRQGIGRGLICLLAQIARGHGINKFVGTALAENRGLWGLIHELTGDLTVRRGGPV